jgi:hypothetical protein
LPWIWVAVATLVAAEAGFGKEGGALMGVFAVTHRLLALKLQAQSAGVGQGFASLQSPAQIVGDGAVVAGRVLEDLDRQVEAGGVGDGAALLGHFRQDAAVVRGIDHHGHGGMVLGGGAQQGRAADVDVLDGGCQVAAGFGHGLLEGVEVDDYQVDGLDAVIPHDLVVKAAATQDATMNQGVKGLDPARHHLREAGVVGDLGDRYLLFRQQAGGAAGGQDLDPPGRQGAGEIDQAGLVGNADESAANGLHLGSLH